MSNNIILQVKNISKRFGGLQATQDVSFDVKENEILSIIGPNGAGKSTLFNLITNFYTVDTGSILFRGEEIVGLTPDQVCIKGITRTFQIARPFPGLSISDNILVALLPKSATVAAARDQVDEILKQVNLDKKANHMGSQLTTLERKRLELGKALATNPQILMLDEVMTGLKPKEMDEMMDLIRELQKSMTIVIVEHVMRVIMAISERVIVLDHGKKIAEGTPQEITSNPEVVSAYLGRGTGNAGDK
ncbi:MAG TPA: ABC transporter ATP-binding protein [Syntrophomonas sp.]|jgi:branched-chain amino acid transport system ATP-binding protein|nr:ABC transporter ATP-binding protein [Syntrophomonas sp.]HCF72087.1 ABC transporter ATP-binding protein [Syntrophomonas sp.]